MVLEKLHKCKEISFLFGKSPTAIHAFISSLVDIVDEIYILPRFKLKQGWCFMDVGANVGAYSVLASRMVGNKGVVISIEPHPDNFRALLFNTKLLKNVIPIQAAIWNKNEYQKLYLPPAAAESSLVFKTSDKSIKIMCLTLDSLYNKVRELLSIDHVDAIKIDVEGAEEKVLEGAKEVLHMVEFVLVEVHNSNRINKIACLLNKYGFAAKLLGSDHIIGIKNTRARKLKPH